jgi:hypothetical protein
LQHERHRGFDVALLVHLLDTTARLSIAYASLLVVGAILTASAWVKFRNRWEFMAAILSWRLVGREAARRLSLLIPVLELFAAVAAFAAIAAGRHMGLAGAAIAGLFLALTFGQLAVLIRSRGSASRCGCFGTGHTIGTATILRAVGLAGVACVPIVAAYPEY